MLGSCPLGLFVSHFILLFLVDHLRYFGRDFMCLRILFLSYGALAVVDCGPVNAGPFESFLLVEA
jgi:hypothetical protein